MRHSVICASETQVLCTNDPRSVTKKIYLCIRTPPDAICRHMWPKWHLGSGLELKLVCRLPRRGDMAPPVTKLMNGDRVD